MLTITPNQLNQYWFYSLTNAQGDIVFLGCERFPSIFALADVLKLPDVPMDEPLTITLHSAFDRSIDAQNARSSYIRNKLAGHTPVYNAAQGAVRRGMIVCEQTGLTYRTQSECASSLNISQGQLSKHLQRAPGYNSVKGMTFRYENPQAIAARGDVGKESAYTVPEKPAGFDRMNGQDQALWHVLSKISPDTRTPVQAEHWNRLNGLPIGYDFLSDENKQWYAQLSIKSPDAMTPEELDRWEQIKIVAMITAYSTR